MVGALYICVCYFNTCSTSIIHSKLDHDILLQRWNAKEAYVSAHWRPLMCIGYESHWYHCRLKIQQVRDRPDVRLMCIILTWFRAVSSVHDVVAVCKCVA